MSSEMQYYCTLFDSAYLSRGLALYQSLEQFADSFTLYVLAMDDACADYLLQAGLEHVRVIRLADFETEALAKVKLERNKGEYCWTCTPFIVDYCLRHYDLEACTYLDADICFYHDPAVLLDEIPTDKSVLITEHRYTPRYDISEKAGRFCVQFVTFKNNTAGRKILNSWMEQCLDWCYDRFEQGKFGDQKYQDDWPVKWSDDVHILKHSGGGVAPWNVQQYNFLKAGDRYSVVLNSGNEEPLVFYHFHAMKFLDEKSAWLGDYELPEGVLWDIYKTYIQQLENIAVTLPVALPYGPFGSKPSLLNRLIKIVKMKPLPDNEIILEGM